MFVMTASMSLASTDTIHADIFVFIVDYNIIIIIQSTTTIELGPIQCYLTER